MKGLLGFTAAVTRRLIRRGLQLLALAVGACVVLVVGYTLYAVNMLPDLQPWHTKRLPGEFSALKHRDLDFSGYLDLEARLFEAASAEAKSWADRGEAFEYSRFNPDSMFQKLAAGAPLNRSFRLTPSRRVGGALLVHGLTDSPYSMRALAESLYRRGFEVTVLRLPGHGTFPSMMTEMRYRDWVAAVRLAARDVSTRTGASQPFYVGGYSTGATLTLNYALDALAARDRRRPDRVLLLSPAIELTAVAALANVIDVLSLVPVPMLEKVRWQTVVAEYDPYKFNSFPVNAARQVNRATRVLQDALLEAEESGRLGRLPPVVTWQSVVDSTVGSTGTVDRLYAHLTGERNRLVIFDVNRQRMLSSLQRPAAGELIGRAVSGNRGYTLEIISNASNDGPDIARTLYLPGSAEPTVEPLASAWPAGVVSLGHVALPFEPNDPVYGFIPGSGHDGVPSLGSLLLRGESDALTISLGSLTRLRSNPFWSLIDQQVGQLVEADVASSLHVAAAGASAQD